MPSPKLFSYTIRIFYEDTDVGGIVYHANYLKYFERARTESLRELDINLSNYLEQNIGFVVRTVTMDYLASAMLDDVITVHTEITQVKRASILFKQHITNHNGTTLCRADILVACVNSQRLKPCAIPQTILGAFQRAS